MVSDDQVDPPDAKDPDRAEPTLAEVFERACPAYMSWGMSFYDYWDGDPLIAKFVREAHEIQQKERNSELWLQGVYIYNAFGVVLGNAFRKRGEKPAEYLSAPIPITPLEMREEAERKAKEEYEAKKRRMKIFMASINATMRNKMRGG